MKEGGFKYLVLFYRFMIKQIMFVVLIVLFGVSSYYLYGLIREMNTSPIQLISDMSNPEGENFSTNIQFYPNMRFASPSISYNISEMCDADKRDRLEEAFSILSNISALRFHYDDNAEITIECKETSLKQIRRERYYIAGEGGPTSVINTSLFYVIQGGEILLLYPKADCAYPVIEVHELLHVFGFEHSGISESIMYPTASCSQRITPEIEDTLKTLYAIPQEADLYFINTSVSKKGAYADFIVNIRNRGLKNAENVMLKIYADSENVKNYNLDEIKLGEGKYLEVSNLKVGRSISSIRFIIEDGEELYLDNNVASFSVPAS